jgi:hypothetical protein
MSSRIDAGPAPRGAPNESDALIEVQAVSTGGRRLELVQRAALSPWAWAGRGLPSASRKRPKPVRCCCRGQEGGDLDVEAVALVGGGQQAAEGIE